MRAANEPIPIGEETIEITQDEVLIRTEAQIYLRLLPKPCLIIECEVPASTRFLSAKYGQSITLIKSAIDMNIVLLQSTGKDGQSKLFFTPAYEPYTVLEKAEEQLETVVFDIINFAKFYGKEPQIIETDGWLIEISSVPEFNEIDKTLKTQGGYAITHCGTLKQSNGNTFPISEAQSVIEALQLFLSFMRGAYCSPVLPVGTNCNGEEVWKQWGTRTIEPWGWAPSFFDTVPSIPLADVFHGFWSAFNKNPIQKKTIQIALQWYLRSNRNNGDMAGGLFLSQAALERLANLYGFNKRHRSAKNIRAFLDKLKISTKIPSHLKSLQNLVDQHPARYGTSDGPYVLTEVRNNLIHPDHIWEDISGNFEYETWNLAQWYIELALLAVFGFNGQYGNRLINGRPTYMVKSVPWAAEQKD